MLECGMALEAQVATMLLGGCRKAHEHVDNGATTLGLLDHHDLVGYHVKSHVKQLHAHIV